MRLACRSLLLLALTFAFACTGLPSVDAGPDLVGRYLRNFADEAQVDELMTVHPSPTIDERLRSIDLLADALDPLHV